MVPGESVTLLRRNGEVIAGHPDIEGQRGRRVPEKSPWYDRVASGGGTYRSPGFLSDVPKIVTVHPLRDYPLVVDVDMSEQAALGNWYAEAVGILAAMITVSTGIIILFAMISAQFRRQEASERRLKAYAEMAADWFWVQDPDHRYMTEASATVTTHSTEVGKTRWDLADPAMDPERWVQHKKDLEARRPFRDFRWESIDRNGQRHYLSSNGDPVFDKSGTFLGYQGTGRDITAEVVASARALQADMLLKDAVNCMSEGFVIFDGDDKLVMCNDAYRRICGDSVRLLPGVSYEQILWQCAPDNAHYSDDEKASVIAKLISAHRAAEESFEYRLTDGSTILATDRRMSSGGIAGLRINITDLKRTQEALRESESRLDRAQEIAGLGSWELDVTNGRYAWSKENYRIRGLPPDFEPTEENTFAGIHPDDIRLTSEWLADLKAGRERGPIEKRFTLPDGQVRVLRSEGLAIVDPDGIIRRVAGTTQDVTERRTIEKQLAQSQKMEAIGTLTGGMAHDFNNGLGVIIGNLDLLARRITADELATELCREAVLGATRCAELIRRLLAFARRQSLRPETTELNALVTETTHMLRHTLGENVTIKLDLADEVWKVTVDPVQLEAALVNLATNARDAMPKGGRIEIRTRNVEIDEAYQAQEPDIRPGAFALIEVSDTGIGMPPEIMGRIFEPFFTTKGQGAGTGLGLAMTFGFVKQSGGHISVYSEPGLGSSFRIYLPREEAERPVATDLPEASEIIGGDETILLVEDNAQLLRVASRQLLGLGYRVHEAEDAAAALAIMERGETPDLLFTDVVMPGKMDGLDLAYEALRQLPNIRILLASGFPGVRGGDDRLTDSPFTLLNKPYRRDAMARAVRRVLDGDKVVMKTARRSDRLPETQPG
jgi:signal transduction histidine kinase/ActR/RegA family two-component response regulator